MHPWVVVAEVLAERVQAILVGEIRNLALENMGQDFLSVPQLFFANGEDDPLVDCVNALFVPE